MTNGNDLAYPTFDQNGICPSSSEGLTKREYFAAMAMQGLCQEGAWSKTIQNQSEALGSTSSESIAVYAVDLADALIEALNKTK